MTSSSPYFPSRWLVDTGDVVGDPDVFPLLPGQMLITSKSPLWSTAISTAHSGRERRRRNWSYPKWRIKLQYEVVRQRPALQELSQLLSFFNLHGGKFGSFFYRDPTDNMVSDQLIGVGDGATSTFQLVRTMTYGVTSFTEPVRGVLGPSQLTVGGAMYTDFEIGTSGEVVLDDAPDTGDEVRWTGTMMHLVRFGQDDLEFAQLTEALWSQRGLELITVKR